MTKQRRRQIDLAALQDEARQMACDFSDALSDFMAGQAKVHHVLPDELEKMAEEGSYQEVHDRLFKFQTASLFAMAEQMGRMAAVFIDEPEQRPRLEKAILGEYRRSLQAASLRHEDIDAQMERPN